MYSQLFRQTFWRLEFLPQVFVAMSFAEKYRAGFENVIAPAIRGQTLETPANGHFVEFLLRAKKAATG
jgi:hypothetical protein